MVRILKIGLLIAALTAFFLPHMAFAGTAIITWQASPEPDLVKYRIYWSTTPGAYGSYKAEVPKGTTTYTATELTEGLTYYFVVTAVDGAGNESGYSSPVVQKTLPPGPPALISPANSANQPGTSITLSWNASTGADNYDLYVQTESGQEIFSGWVGNVQNYTVSGFPNDGTKFRWGVYARNSAGVSDGSTTFVFVNGSAVTVSPPPAPTLVSPANRSKKRGTSITFSWNASAGADNYNLRVQTPSGQVFFDSWVGNVQSYTVSGFPSDGSNFLWEVYAGSSAGVSPGSGSWRFQNR